ncbi:hypothetical protein VN1249_07990 [Helicobacter pylori]|nr:hypothetical protein VN1249_07990 [Helicobacter pylori]
MSTKKMEKKLEKAKAYYSQVEEAVKKADAMIDQFQAIDTIPLFTAKKKEISSALRFQLS